MVRVHPYVTSRAVDLGTILLDPSEDKVVIIEQLVVPSAVSDKYAPFVVRWFEDRGVTLTVNEVIVVGINFPSLDPDAEMETIEAISSEHDHLRPASIAAPFVYNCKTEADNRTSQGWCNINCEGKL